MQFLLSAEEYRALDERVVKLRTETNLIIADLCRQVANLSPGRSKCIRDMKDEGYCDDCPVRDVCTHPHKEWSK
jgi:hypothetical protein